MHAIKTFLPSVTDGGEWLASQHGRCTPGAEDQNRALVEPDSRTGGAREEENKYLFLPGTEQ